MSLTATLTLPSWDLRIASTMSDFPFFDLFITRILCVLWVPDLYRKMTHREFDIVLYGESLGSGVAVQLAVSEPVGAVVLDAPYTSILNLALRNYFYLPVRPLLVDRYESDRRITSINAPVLVLHGRRDGVIPVEMGEALFALAVEPKKLVVFPNGGHSDLDEFGAVEVVHDWLATLRVGK